MAAEKTANPTGEGDFRPSDSNPGQRVGKRRVHFIGGFDPRGAKHYYRLYREEAAKQAVHLGSVLEIGPRRKVAPDVVAWTIKGEWDGRPVATDYQYMVWDDLVREHWNANPWPLIHDAAWIRLIYAGRFSHGAGLTAALPLIFFCVFGLLIFLAGALAWLLAHALGTGGILAAALALVPMCAVSYMGARLNVRFGVMWVFRNCIFGCRWARKTPKYISDRINAMSEWIDREQERDPADEVLIVGHSNGAAMSAAVTARLIERFAGRNLPPVFHLLTLGQGIPYLTSNPANSDLPRDLSILNEDNRIPWTDASARADPICFFKVDPIAAAGLQPRFADRPLHVVVRIYKMFNKEAYAGMRRNKLRIHFQYLMAYEIKSDYDYFRITAGPDRLSGWRQSN